MDNIPFAPIDEDNQLIFPASESGHSTPSLESALLEIDGEEISVQKGLAYLKDSGELPKFLLEITRQYLLEQEIKNRLIEEPNVEILEQFILELRLQQELTTIDKFQKWLAEQGLNYHDFREKMKFLLQMEECKRDITEPKLESHFLEKKDDLEKVVLSRIIVSDLQLANELKEQLDENPINFTNLAKQHSIVDDAAMGGMLGAIPRGNLPEEIARSLKKSIAGQVVGPLPIDDRYCILKIEEILPAELDSSLRQSLAGELFDTWLKERIQSANIKQVLDI